MGSFSYTARDKQGAVQKGLTYGNDRASAAASLLDRGLTPILIKEEAGGKSGAKSKFDIKAILQSRIKLTDKVVFSRQFSTMINAGVPIVQALGILGDQT